MGERIAGHSAECMNAMYRGPRVCICGADPTPTPEQPRFDNETEACRHCPTPDVHPTRIGGILTYEGRCDPDTCERHDHSEAQARPEQDEAVRLALHSIIRAEAALATAHDALATPPPVPAAPPTHDFPSKTHVLPKPSSPRPKPVPPPWRGGAVPAAPGLDTHDFLESLRSPRNSLGKLALPKGLMEWAVEDAYEADGVVTWVGDPEDGITQTNLSELADAIITALHRRLSSPEASSEGGE